MELTIEQALQQGVVAHKEGKFGDAERLYRAILQSKPKHPDANHNLGVLAVSINKAEAALPLFKTALEANPQIEQFWLSYIDALIKENHLEKAKAVIEQSRKMGLAGDSVDALEVQLKKIVQPTLPNSSEKKKILTLKEKRKKISESNQQKKQTRSKSVSGVKPSQLQLNNLIGYYQRGQHNEAETLALFITQKFPEHLLSWKILGEVFRQTGKKSEAVKVNQRAVQLAPKDAEAQSNLGATLQEMGRFDEAEASYRQAIALEPDHVEAHFNLASALKNLGKLDEAEARYRHLVAMKPDFAEAHYNLGVALQEMGRLEEAEVSYGQAIKWKSDYAEAHSNLGIVLKKLGRWDEAEVSFGKAIALKPHYTDALMNRWRLLFDKGDFEAALKDSEFCNTKVSRQHSLETLYALGHTKEVYQRIEMEFQVDEGNIATAAFASFLAKIEKKDTANNFCNNPIDFIQFDNISSHLEDSNAFITKLIEELYGLKTVWEPSQTATQKGFQTPVHINLFANPSVNIARLKSIILDELDSYYLRFCNEDCSFMQNWPSKKNLWGWHVILKHQGYQTAHIHSSGWLSGVIYLKVVPAFGKDEGAIEFSLNGEYYSNVKSPNLTYLPKQGDIVFFPSSLHHQTVPFTTDTDRIIVSFDLMPDTLTKLV